MLLSLSIWIPILGGLAVMTTGRDKAEIAERNAAANFTRWVALIVALAGFLVTVPLYTGFDPATASAPFVATLVDVTGLIIYFSVALMFLRGTLL